jgi:hypothetical protein
VSHAKGFNSTMKGNELLAQATATRMDLEKMVNEISHSQGSYTVNSFK